MDKIVSNINCFNNRLKFKKIILVFFSIFLSIIGIEFILFLFPSVIKQNYYESGWNHWTSGATYTDYLTNKDGYNQKYIFDNNFGYINLDIVNEINSSSNNLDTKKILVLGDSVSEDGTYIEKVELGLKYLNSNQKISLLNGGHSGYDTAMELNFLKNIGLKYEPELVILQVNPNDFSGTPVIVKNGANGWLAFDNRDSTFSINHSLFKYSRIYQFLIMQVMKNNYNKEKDLSELRIFIEKPLSEMSILLKEKGINFVVVYFPFLGEEDWAKSTRLSMNNIINNLRLENNYLDLSNYFNKYPKEFISIDDTHPNEYGDDLAANAIINFIQSKGL